MIGKVDTSDDYLKTIFEAEVQALLENYTELIENATVERPVLLHALSQLRAAETRLRSFYSRESQDVAVNKDSRYFCPSLLRLFKSRQPPKMSNLRCLDGCFS